MTYSPDHITSLITFAGEDSADRMQQVLGLAHNLGGSAVALTGSDTEWLGLSAAELERQHALSTPILRAVYDINRSKSKSTMGLCERMAMRGITTVRDVLVVGRDAFLSSHAAGRTRESQRELLARAVQSVCPNDPWLDQPQVLDIARYCVGLDQIHAGVLPTFRRQMLLRTQNYHRVADFIRDDPIVQTAFLGKSFSFYASCRRDALRFAAEFTAAKGHGAPPAP